LSIDCRDQEEIDYYWNRLTEDGDAGNVENAETGYKSPETGC